MTVKTFKQAVHPNDQSLQPRKFARPCVRHVATFRKFRAGSQKTGRPKERLPERDIARATIRISTISLREPWDPNAANLHIDRFGLNYDFISEPARLKPTPGGAARGGPRLMSPSHPALRPGDRRCSLPSPTGASAGAGAERDCRVIVQPSAPEKVI
jgi:hypothetical protein